MGLCISLRQKYVAIFLLGLSAEIALFQHT